MTSIAGTWVIPLYSGRYKFKTGSGPDLEMKYAPMKLEAKVIGPSKEDR